MTITPFTIYIWRQADHFLDIAPKFLGITVICLIFIHILIFQLSQEKDCDKSFLPTLFKLRIFGYIMAVLGSIVFFFMPKSDTIAMMYVIPQVVESKVVKEDLPEIYEAALKALKDNLGIPKTEK